MNRFKIHRQSERIPIKTDGYDYELKNELYHELVIHEGDMGVLSQPIKKTMIGKDLADYSAVCITYYNELSDKELAAELRKIVRELDGNT